MISVAALKTKQNIILNKAEYDTTGYCRAADNAC